MKKGIKLALFGVGLFALGGFGLGLSLKQEIKPIQPTMALVEGEEAEESLPCQVVVEKAEHGSLSVSIEEGNVGDICVVTAKHDLLYKVDSVLVNGTALVESEHVSGEFSFALVEGENKITAKFIVDEEVCGALTTIVKQASEKDWNNLFTVENIIVLVKWVLDGGILIAMIRYYVKDKRLANKLEKATKDTLAEIIPDATKETVVKVVQEVITPMFTEMKADYIELMKASQVMAKCYALAQDGSVDAKRAILDELAGLKIGDLDTIGEVKKEIEETIARHTKAYEDTLAAIKKLGEKNSEFINSVENPKEKLEGEVAPSKPEAIE